VAHEQAVAGDEGRVAQSHGRAVADEPAADHVEPLERERHAGRDVEHAIGVPRVHDRLADALAHDREVVEHVEVAGQAEVVGGLRQLADAGADRNDDRVGARQGIGLLDRGAQRAFPALGRARAVPRHEVREVVADVDRERRALRGGSEGQREERRRGAHARAGGGRRHRGSLPCPRARRQGS
jgi:hypothetical protein